MKNQKTTNIINFKKLREFVRSADISSLQKIVLIDLLLYAGTEGDAFPSQQTLSKDLGYSDRHIRTCLEELKLKGWIMDWEKRGYSKSNSYILSEELYFRNDKTIRKSTSADSGTILPVQSGTPFPPKVNQESNQLSGSTIQQLFEKASNTKCTSSDNRRLHELCKKHSVSLVEDAIKEIATRRYPTVKVGLISKILGDWEKDGKPLPKPEFNPCNIDGCENGYKFNGSSAVECQCLLDYKKVGL